MGTISREVMRLADVPPPSRTSRQFPCYEEVAEPEERSLAMIRSHAQGWSISTIARYLDVSRPTNYAILKRWDEEGVWGLSDKSEQLHRLFYAMRFLRQVDRLGYVHFRRWKLYGEETLARHPALIWLHGDALAVEYEETPLLNTLFAINQTKSTSKTSQRPGDLRLPIVPQKAGFGY